MTLSQQVSSPVSASNCAFSVSSLVFVYLAFSLRPLPLGRRRGCWGRLKTEKRLSNVTLSHPQSDESGFQLNCEAWGKGVRVSPDPSGAVLYLVLKSGMPYPRGATLWSP